MGALSYFLGLLIVGLGGAILTNMHALGLSPEQQERRHRLLCTAALVGVVALILSAFLKGGA